MVYLIGFVLTLVFFLWHQKHAPVTYDIITSDDCYATAWEELDDDKKKLILVVSSLVIALIWPLSIFLFIAINLITFIWEIIKRILKLKV